jgi:hypothetical protein
MIRQMKIEGGTLEDCSRELHLLADFVRAQAAGCGGMAESYQLATYRQGLQPLPLLSKLRLGCSQTVPATLPGCLVASLSRC